MAKLDIIGKKFQRLTVLRESGKSKAGKIKFICVCDCGNEINVVGSGLVSGNTGSCGCLQRERTGAAAKIHASTHGLSGHALYPIWIDIRRRCFDKRVSSYKNYGARGVTMCDEWKNDFKVFYDWCMRMGWVAGLEIDRYPDNNGNYEPSNCRLATTKENCNNKRNNCLLTVNGVTKTAAQWAEVTGTHRSTVSRRIRSGAVGNEAIFGVGSGNKFSKNM